MAWAGSKMLERPVINYYFMHFLMTIVFKYTVLTTIEECPSPVHVRIKCLYSLEQSGIIGFHMFEKDLKIIVFHTLELRITMCAIFGRAQAKAITFSVIAVGGGFDSIRSLHQILFKKINRITNVPVPKRDTLNDSRLNDCSAEK